MTQPGAAQGERCPLGTDMARALGGWAVSGAIAGAWVGALAVRANTSLEGPGQAGPFVASTVLAYSAMFLPFGLVIALAARICFKVRASFVASAGASLLGFGAFALTQFMLAKLTWRSETNAVSIAAAVIAALVVAIVARIAIGRADALRRAIGVLLAVLAVASTTFAFVTTSRDTRTVVVEVESASAKLEPVRSASGALPRVMLIGVDGADWDRMRPLLAAGRLPNFARLCDGAFQALLETIKPTWSPIVWTSIATGVRDDAHGVRDFTELELLGLSRGVQRTYPKHRSDALLPRDVGLVPLFDSLVQHRHMTEMPVTSLHRRSKAVWNILSEHGVKCGIVRWWATWPAEQFEGYMLSDNDPLLQVFVATKDESISVNSTTSYMTWPPELATSLIELIKADGPIDAGQHDSVERLLAHAIFSDLTEAERAKLRGQPDVLEEFELITRGDKFANRTALQMWNEKKVDLLAVYLRAVDNISHRFAGLTGVVDRTYELTDRLLGELLDAGGADPTYVLVSDHGWSYAHGTNFGHNHGPPGVIIVKGPAVNASADVQASVLDVTPTLLALYGLPSERDMPGKPLAPVFTPDSPAAVDRPRIDSYGAYRPLLPRASDDSEAGRRQAVELLRGLGYLK